MSEGTEKSSSGSVVGNIASAFIPHPTLAPVKYWQGIVEIVARGVLLVRLLIEIT